jgi:transcriptional activator protein UGA3
MEPKLVCGRCAKIKQACAYNGIDPCPRCKRLDVPCEPLPRDGRAAISELTSIDKPVRITRTHTGCVACRQRKRKCDEVRPKCGDCRRLCLDCEYVTPQRRRRQKSEAGQTDASQDSTQKQIQVTAVDIGAHPSDLTAEGAIEADLDGSLDQIDMPELWQFPHSPSSDLAAIYGSFDAAPSPTRSVSMVRLSSTPMLAADEDKSLLNHYIKVVAPVLSRRDDNQANPYLNKILTVAFSNDLVMNAVLALSASHWKKMQPTAWKRGIIHQTNTMQGLAKLLPNIDSDSADVALAATLMLAMIELFDGTSSHWKFHLDGVRRLLAAVEREPRWARQTAHRAFFRQLYHFLDSATTISTCHPPLLESPKQQSVDSPSYSDDDEVALYGIPRSLFHFVDKLNGLAYQRKFRDDPVFENMFQASATSLQKDIQEWSDAHGIASSPVLHQDSTFHATRAFEQALQLRLHQIINGYSITHEKVAQHVDNILESVQEIRYGSSLESSLVFPLVMAGCACDDEPKKRIVQDRFLIMERTYGFRYIYTAHELVQTVWKERDLHGGEQEVNWAAIRYFHIPGLALV